MHLLGLDEEKRRRDTQSCETTHVWIATNLRCRSADVNERETSRGMCVSSAIVNVILDVIDLLLLSFVPRVVVLNR